MCFPRSSVINEISLALWALVCGGLWAAAAAIAPLKERRASQNNPIEIHFILKHSIFYYQVVLASLFSSFVVGWAPHQKEERE